MTDTLKPPAGFDAIPVGGPAAVLDLPRPLPTPPRPAPRQATPLPPLPDAEPPKSPSPTRNTLPPSILPDGPPAVAPEPEPNPMAGSPPPKASVFSGLLWDLLRPNRAKVAVLAGVVSLAAGAFGLNMLIPTGTAPQTPPAKVKIPVEEPPKPALPTPAPAKGGWEGIGEAKPTPRAGEQPKYGPDGLPLIVPLQPSEPATHDIRRGSQPELPLTLNNLPPLPGQSAEGAQQPLHDSKLQRTNGTGGLPQPGGAGGLPALPAALPQPGGAGGAAAIPSAPVMSDSGGTVGLPGLPLPGGPKPAELTLPPVPGAGTHPTVVPEPIKPAPVTLPGLPPVPADPLPGAGGALPLPGGTLPQPGGPLPGLPVGVEAKPQPGAGLPPALLGGLPLPANPEVKPQPGVGTPPLPGVGALPLPGGHEIKPALPGLPAEPKPMELKPLEPVVGAGGVAPAPLPAGFNTPPALQPPVSEAKTEYDVDLHQPRAGDTYATVSQAYYNGPQYAAALQAFNKNRPISQLAEVQVPPLHVIRKFAPARPADPPPERFQPVRGPGEDIEWNRPGAAQGGQPVYTIFPVPRKGLTLRDVAKMYYGNERSWTKLNNPKNPKFDPDEELPVGTQLHVPTEPVNFR